MSRILRIASLSICVTAAGSGVHAQQESAAAQPVPREAQAEVKSLVQTVSAVPALRARNERYTLRAGDVVQINFVLAPSFNQLQAVQPDGYIALQEAGELYVAGKTVPELTDAIREKYAKIMQNPNVTVVLKEFEHPYFIATGQVVKAGKYDLRGGTTVAQAIAIAGGFSDAARTSHILLFRRVSDSYVSIKQLNLKTMLNRGNLTEDVELQPGDLVFVPRSVTATLLKALIPHATTGLYIPTK